MIVSFGDRKTEEFYHGGRRWFPPEIHAAALRKLDMLEGAHNLEDLRVPPGNRLKALKGDRVGFCSIRVNQQWRLVFRWKEEGAYDVVLVDYH